MNEQTAACSLANCLSPKDPAGQAADSRSPARPVRRRLGEQGEGKLAVLFWLVVLGILTMVGFEYVPARYHVSQLQDHITGLAEQAGIRYRSGDEIRKEIVWKAEQLGLPVDDKSFTVELNSSNVTIRGQYIINLEFPFYTYRWQVQHEIHRRLFRV